MRRAAVLPALLLAVVAAAASSTRPPGEPAPGEGYLGPESCRSCHVELYERWEQSAHARSTQRATPENMPPAVLEGAAVEHPPGRSAFRREGDRFFVTTLGADGKEHEYPLTHIVGPHRISFFLTRMEDDGRLQVLPGMREIPTDVWFDYTNLIFDVPNTPYETPPTVKPGEPSFWTGPIRAYDRSCGRCHTSGRRKETTLADGRTRLEWDPLEVDCEACHGPGADHVEFWRNPPSRPGAKDPILVLRDLPRDRAQGLCLWCHMESDVASLSYRPGDDVFEHLSPTLLDRLERIDAAGRPLELIYDGLVFQFSACAEASGLTCLSCHDAHGGPYRSDLLTPPDRTFTLCNGCHMDLAAEPRKHTFHDPAGSGGRCVSCHMPFLSIERGHGVVRDHTIGSPMLDLFGDRVATDACTWCHTGARGAPDDAPKLTDAEIRDAYERWFPGAKLRPRWVEPIALGRAGRGEGFFPLVQVANDESIPRLVRASAVRLLARYPDRALTYLVNLVEDDDSLIRRNAAAALGTIRHPDADLGLRLALSDPSRPVRSFAARAALSGWSRVRENPELLKAVLPVLEEETRALPDDDLRWFRLGAARQIAGDERGALEAYERKLGLDPYAVYIRQAVERLRESVKEK